MILPYIFQARRAFVYKNDWSLFLTKRRKRIIRPCSPGHNYRVISVTEALLPLDLTDDATDPALDLFTASGKRGGNGTAPSPLPLLGGEFLAISVVRPLRLDEFLLHRESTPTPTGMARINPAGKGNGEKGAFDALSDGVMDLWLRYWLIGESMTDSGGVGAGKSAGLGVDTLSRMFRPATGAGMSGVRTLPGVRRSLGRLPATGVGGLFARPLGWTSVPSDCRGDTYSSRIVLAGYVVSVSLDAQVGGLLVLGMLSCRKVGPLLLTSLRASGTWSVKGFCSFSLNRFGVLASANCRGRAPASVGLPTCIMVGPAPSPSSSPESLWPRRLRNAASRTLSGVQYRNKRYAVAATQITPKTETTAIAAVRFTDECVCTLAAG